MQVPVHIVQPLLCIYRFVISILI